MSSAPLTAKQAQGARSREEILDAAELLMGTHGYAATSISTLAKASGLPASSIYWHFTSKSGLLAAVMERGAQRYFTAVTPDMLGQDPEPRRRLHRLWELSNATVRVHARFLRLFVLLLLDVEGEHAQQQVVGRVRTEGRRLLRLGLVWAYRPWGDEMADRVGDELVDVAMALFDGSLLATEMLDSEPAPLLIQAVDALHALAEQVRAGA